MYSIAEFQTKDDMEDAIKKLDDTGSVAATCALPPRVTRAVVRALVRLLVAVRRAVARVRARLLRARTPRAVRAPDRPRLLLLARPLARTRPKRRGSKKVVGLHCNFVARAERVFACMCTVGCRSTSFVCRLASEGNH